jgi:3-hydroxyacyl-[acyl-carrier-protein] dehydratase
MPSTLVTEALAQLGAFTAVSGANGLGFLSSLKKSVEFIDVARPGGCVELYYEVVRSRKGFIYGKGVASVNNRVIVKADEIIIYLSAHN